MGTRGGAECFHAFSRLKWRRDTKAMFYLFYKITSVLRQKCGFVCVICDSTLIQNENNVKRFSALFWKKITLVHEILRKTLACYFINTYIKFYVDDVIINSAWPDISKPNECPMISKVYDKGGITFCWKNIWVLCSSGKKNISRELWQQMSGEV